MRAIFLIVLTMAAAFYTVYGKTMVNGIEEEPCIKYSSEPACRGRKTGIADIFGKRDGQWNSGIDKIERVLLDWLTNESENDPVLNKLARIILN